MTHSRIRALAIAAAAAVLCAVAAAAPSAEAAPVPAPAPICCVTSRPPTALAIDGTTAYVGGPFRHVGRLTGGLGVLDTAGGQEARRWPTVDGSVEAAAPDGAGGWYVAGEFDKVGNVARQGLAHLRAGGSLDPNWAPSTDGRVKALVVTDGRVWIGGRFSQVDGEVAHSIAGLDGATGERAGPHLDISSVATGNPLVYALAIRSFLRGTPSGIVTVRQLYVGGSFDRAGAEARRNLAAFDLSDGATTSFDPEPNDTVYALAMSPSVLYVGGSFTTVGTSATPRANLAAFRLTTGEDMSWPPMADGAVGSLAYAPAVAATATAPARPATVYAAGGFTHVTYNAPVARNGLAAFDAQTGEVRDWAVGLVHHGEFSSTAGVTALSVFDDTVYIAGRFEWVNGEGNPRTNLAAVDAGTGAVTAWDPDAASPVLGASTVVADPVSRTVLAGGLFDTVGGERRHGIAAIDLTTGRLTGFDPEVDGEVDALLVSGRTLYAGGSFSTVNGSVTRHNLAAFDRGSGAATAFDPDVNLGVLALTAAGGHVFAGGGFYRVNGTVPRDHLAAFDPVTGTATAFQENTDAVVRALASAGATVYVGGDFGSVAGSPRHYLGAVQERAGTSGVVLPFAPEPSNAVSTLAVDGSTLYAGGGFTTVNGGVARQGAAAFDRVSGGATAWNPADGAHSGLAPTQDGVFAVGSAAELLDRLTGARSPWDPRFPGEARVVAASPGGGVVLGGRLAGNGNAGALSHVALTPAGPPAPTAAPGDGRATVTFSAPPDGGAPIRSYTVTASPCGRTATGSGRPITVTGLANGTRYTFTVAATNAAGMSHASPPSNPVTPAAPAPAGGDGGQPGGGGRPGTGGQGGQITVPDTMAPAISRLSVSHRRFAPAKRNTALTASRRTKHGTVLRFSLSEAARTTVTVARRRRGHLRRVARLTRTHTKQGRNRVAFTGRLRRHALKAGRYVLTLRATDPAGNRSRPRTAKVIVLGRRP